MAQVRIDLLGDATSLSTQIANVIGLIRQLERSAVDVYAMRGDAGMVGLQREITSANAALTQLKDQLATLNTFNTSAIVNNVQGLTREFNSARESAAAFRNQSGSAGVLAQMDNAQRQVDAQRYLDDVRQRSHQQEIAAIAQEQAAFTKALQDKQRALSAFYKEQTRAQQEAMSFAQKIAPTSSAGQQTAEQKRQYDAATDAAERLGQAERKVQADTLAAAKAHQAERDALRQKIELAQTQAQMGSSVPIGYKTDSSSGKLSVVKGFKESAEEAESALAKLAPGLRHIIALFDEAMRGQRGAFISSVGALVRDQQAISGIIGALISPWGLVAAAGVAAAVAIGVAFEQAFQKMRTVNEAQIALAFRGAPVNPQQYADIEKQITASARATHEWYGTIRELYQEFEKLPAAAESAWPKFDKIAKGMAGASGDPAKAFKPLGDALKESAEAGARWVEKNMEIKQATDGSNRSLEQQVAALRDTSQKFNLVADAILKARGPIIEHNIATREAKQGVLGWLEALAISSTGMASAGLAANNLSGQFGKVFDSTKKLDLPGTTQQFRDFEAAIIEGNSGIAKQTELLTTLANALQRTAQSASEATAQQNLMARVDTMSAQPGEEKRHQIAMENIAEEARKRQQDPEAQLEAERARAAEILRTQTAKRVEAGADPTQAGIDATSSAEYIAAQNKILDAQRNVAKEKVELEKDAQRAIIQNEMIGTNERINAQRRVVELTKQEERDGLTGKREVAQEEIKLQTQIRQERTKTFQEARDNARAEVELAKGNVAEIIAAYDKLRAAAKTAGMPPAAFAQIDREQIRDLESAQSKAFSAMTEFNSAQERLGNLQIAAEKARLNESVAAHKMSKEDAARAEGDYTQKVLAEDEKRVESEIANDNLTKEQKEKLYEHLAELYQKDADLQLQAQEKITQAIEAENKRREAIFTKTFDTIGSEGEKAIEGMFDRSKTHGQVLAEAARNIFKTVAESAGKELSEIGGQKLGPSLGLTSEESKGGLGQVLGNALFKAVGLEKEVKKDPMANTAEKMSKAVDAQTKAAELQKDAAKELKEAGQALKGTSGQHGVPSQYDTGPVTPTTTTTSGGTSVTIGPAPAQAQAAVGYAMEASGEKLKNYCATLVNQALEKAGVQGSGSGLASSFKSYGTPVDPSQVRAGDVFYSPPSGWGDTGHVGLTTGPVEGGRVPVMSSHMQGSPDNPAGTETRSVSNLIFRRPAYDEGQSAGSQVGMVKLDQSASQVVSQGVQSGQQQASATIQNAVEQGAQSGNDSLVQADEQQKTSVDANRTAIDKNTASTDKNSTALQSTQTSGGGGGGSEVAKGANDTKGGFALLTQGLGMAASAAALFGPRMSTAARTVLGAVGAITQLSSFMKNANDTFNLFGTATKAVTTATTLEQGAKTLNASATAIDTTAMQTNAAAASTSGAGGFLGGIFKLFAFSQGGIVPSAAGGMVVPGGGGATLSVLHPEEMVLPSHLSKGLQGMINTGGGGGVANNTLNYSSNVTGYHPFGTRDAFESMLRTNSGSMMDFVRNEFKNGSYR